MQSTCPNCKKQIEHEDFLFEVHCDCGSRFNPFMNLEQAAETPAPAAADAGALGAPTWEEPPAEQNFQESNSVFAELKDFAEGTLSSVPPRPGVQNALEQQPAAPSPRPARAAVPSNPSDAIITSGDGLPGYHIEAYLPPVSAASALDAGDSNPMRPGFDALWEQALACGANGVVAVRWVLSPDGSKVVLSGTPVRCTKDGA